MHQFHSHLLTVHKKKIIIENFRFSRSCSVDRLTSFAIPVAFAVVAAGSAVKGLYGMYTGTGKME